MAKFANLWTQIGKSYFSPVLEAKGDVKIVDVEPIRKGEPQTLVAEWCGSLFLKQESSLER